MERPLKSQVTVIIYFKLRFTLLHRNTDKKSFQEELISQNHGSRKYPCIHSM